MDSISSIVKRLREGRISEAKHNYDDASDKELVSLAQDGDQYAFEVLLKRYDYFIYKMTKKYIMDTQDPDDVKQLAQIGFWDAVKKWDLTGDFEAYAGMIVKNKLINELRKDSTEKTMFNTKASSLDEPLAGDEEGESSVADETPSSGLTPDEDYEGREGESEILAFMKEKFSEKELKVVDLYIKGYKVSEIVEEMEDMKYKQVENALMRVKNKLADFLRAKGKFKESRNPRINEDEFLFSPEEKAILTRVMKKINEEPLVEASEGDMTLSAKLDKLGIKVDNACIAIEEAGDSDSYTEAYNALDDLDDEVRALLSDAEEEDDEESIEYCEELRDQISKAKNTEYNGEKEDPYDYVGMRHSDFF